MDYKQKYEEAIERCKKEFNFNNLAYSHEEIRERLEHVFPKLKDNDDEKIRKELLYYIQQEKNYIESKVKPENSPKLQFLIDAISWLEKQGEQKPTNKIKPRFKVGDWIVKEYSDVSTANQVVKVKWLYSDYFQYTLDDGTYFKGSSSSDSWESLFHLWTIQDAKDGDVLYTSSTASNEVFIFKGLSKEGNIKCYCSYDSEDKYCEGEYHFIGKPSFTTHPATKEKYELLFQKIHEAGYEWDAEKKELKKVESKSAWSEDDEKHYQGCLHVMNLVLNAKPYLYYNDYLWLKSLKERIKGE